MISTTNDAAWAALLLAHGRVTDNLDRDLSERCGISLAEYEVLDHLAAAEDHTLRMNELADLVRLSPSGLTRRFDTLVRRGWVLREPCADDRRGINARLTPAGLEVRDGAAGVHRQGVQSYLVDHLEARELECMVDALGRVAAANGSEISSALAAAASAR